MNFDVAVIGAGLVGTAFARAARGLSVALLASAPHAPGARPQGAALDSRLYAISPANAAFLSGLGVWQRMAPSRLAPVHAMRVFGDDGRAMLEFDAYRTGVSELAWIVEEAELLSALWQGIEGCETVTVLHEAHCTDLDIGADAARVQLADGRTLSAALVAGADGANSFVRARAGLDARPEPYGQTAVVANFDCERPHQGTAFQWFQGDAVLALLPLPGNRVSMVWSLPEGLAEHRMGLDADALCAEVRRASQGVLGALTLVTPARGFALRRLRLPRIIAPRVALLGDAAHVVHPLAGQGANLGFQDARELAAVLSGRPPQGDAGDHALLRRYARARAEPVFAMDATVHGLQQLFGARNGVLASLRNTGLQLVDRLPVVKNLLMRHAIG
ncbi:MAG TPA: UbiH/UbiF family hydroxylase [Burkholderiales bacterium]